MTTTISQQQLIVNEVWRQIRDTYERNARDIVYAYGMARNFTSVDSLYGEATSVKCSLVVVIDPQHHAFDKFLRYANSLMNRHGILLLSLTWLRTDEYSEHDLRMEEIRRFNEHLRTICYESVAVSTATAATVTITNDDAMIAYVDSTETIDFIQENEIGEENRRSSPPDNDKSQLYDMNVQSSSLGDVVTNVDDDDNDDDDDDADDDETENILFAMPLGANMLDMEQWRFKDSVLRNRILTHFFGKLLFYCRRIPLCDMLNIIRHKSFRLVHPSTVNRWFRDICIQ